MARYLNPENSGREAPNPRRPARREEVKNQLCPRDGHYCEQPDCGNCMAETAGDGQWQPA